MAATGGGRRRMVLRGFGYTGFTFVMFLAFLWRDLPYSDLAHYVEARAERAGLILEINGLGPGAFPGVTAARIRVVLPPAPETPVDFSEVSIRLTPLDWVGNGTVARVYARFLGGSVEGRIPARNTGVARVRWDGVDLARAPLPPAYAEAGLRGKTSGTLSGRAPGRDLPSLEGKVEARFEGAGVGPGKIRGIPVPQVTLGTGVFRLETVGQGKVAVKEARFEGGDLAASFANGTVLLRTPLARSLINGMLSLAPSPKIEKDLGLLFALFPGSKGSDGRYTARVRGSFAAPRIARR